MTPSATLRAEAEDLAGPLPPLLADASHLASTVLLGAHGRRRAGMGDEFWQYRPANPSDSARAVDWRRSARSDDAHFVREKEWQAAQTVHLWIDSAQSMTFASNQAPRTKGQTARLLGLALSILLIRGGERVGLSGGLLPARGGEVQILRLANILSTDEETAEYGAPNAGMMMPRSRAVFVSDFLGDMGAVEAALTRAADRGVKGALLQVLDPAEEAFPYEGRTRFMSMSGTIEFETQKAGSIRDRYFERLASRKAELSSMAKATGWHYMCHHTDAAPLTGLLWLYNALEHGT